MVSLSVEVGAAMDVVNSRWYYLDMQWHKVIDTQGKNDEIHVTKVMFCAVFKIIHAS